ncbi:MAG: lipoyl(octanoyl) transferase LipB [Alphaproteobacteria bacterium]|nr:lipoyl(octanoyl) transferase LipB [Alphaproteobacteria bacterium]
MANAASFEWRVADSPIPYPEAVEEMERRAAAVESGTAPELIWLLEHPPLYTKGASSTEEDVINPHGLPVYETGRGGKATWHGPGQRVIYVVADLRKRERDVKQHVGRLEEWIIQVLKDFGVTGERRETRIGIWVDHNGKDEKIAAIGVRVRKWVAYHGLALNVNPDLGAFKGIVPCGLPDFGVTSLQVLGVKASMSEVDDAFQRHADILIS